MWSNLDDENISLTVPLLHLLLTEVAAEGTQESLSSLRYRNPAKKVQARLPLTEGPVSTQIDGYFVGGVGWADGEIAGHRFPNVRPHRHVGI